MNSETKEFLKGLLRSAAEITVQVVVNHFAQKGAEKLQSAASAKLQAAKDNREFHKVLMSGDSEKLSAWLKKHK